MDKLDVRLSVSPHPALNALRLWVTGRFSSYEKYAPTVKTMSVKPTPSSLMHKSRAHWPATAPCLPGLRWNKGTVKDPCLPAKELPAAVHAILEGRKFLSDRLKAS